MFRLISGIGCFALRRLARTLPAICGLLWLGAAPVRAQTYDFTFTGTSGCVVCGITQGVFTFAGGNFTSFSGVANGLSAEGLADGSFFLSPITSSSYNGQTAPFYYYIVDGVSNTSGLSVEIALGGVNNFPSYVRLNSGTFALVQGGPSTVVAQTPAPIPGTGALSWLAFGLIGLCYRRKAISAALRSARARIAGRASA